VLTLLERWLPAMCTDRLLTSCIPAGMPSNPDAGICCHRQSRCCVPAEVLPGKSVVVSLKFMHGCIVVPGQCAHMGRKSASLAFATPTSCFSLYSLCAALAGRKNCSSIIVCLLALIHVCVSMLRYPISYEHVLKQHFKHRCPLQAINGCWCDFGIIFLRHNAPTQRSFARLHA